MRLETWKLYQLFIKVMYNIKHNLGTFQKNNELFRDVWTFETLLNIVGRAIEKYFWAQLFDMWLYV